MGIWQLDSDTAWWFQGSPSQRTSGCHIRCVFEGGHQEAARLGYRTISSTQGASHHRNSLQHLMLILQESPRAQLKWKCLSQVPDEKCPVLLNHTKRCTEVNWPVRLNRGRGGGVYFVKTFDRRSLLTCWPRAWPRCPRVIPSCWSSRCISLRGGGGEPQSELPTLSNSHCHAHNAEEEWDKGGRKYAEIQEQKGWSALVKTTPMYHSTQLFEFSCYGATQFIPKTFLANLIVQFTHFIDKSQMDFTKRKKKKHFPPMTSSGISAHFPPLRLTLEHITCMLPCFFLLQSNWPN